MSAPAIPAFDPDSPDAAILEAYEKVRAFREWSYSQDYLCNIDNAAWLALFDGPEADARDAEELANEKAVYDNWANTPTGVALQLSLTLILGGQDRWVDAGLMTEGLRSLWLKRDRLDGRDQYIVTAAYELLHIEFEQAWVAYEGSVPRYNLAIRLPDLVNSIARAAGDAADGIAELKEMVGTLEAALCNNAECNRLIRTLAPDWECYKRKALMALAEGYADEAAPWLVRDVNFLMGAIAPEKEAA